MKVTREFVRDGAKVSVTAQHVDGDRYRVQVGDRVLEYRATATADGGVWLQRQGDDAPSAGVAFTAATSQSCQVRVDGHTWTLEVPSARRGGDGAHGADGTVRAPMTGTVLDVRCAVGDVVEADQTLVVVSAMKMEHKLHAGVAGVVQKVAVAKNAIVDQGAVLVVVEPQAAE